MYDDKDFIGRKIRYYRKSMNMTQAELAEKIGLSEKHIGKIEAGMHQPSISTFFKFVRILGMDLDEFGVNLPAFRNPLREQIIEYINDSSDMEMNIILPVIKCLKETLKKNRIR